MTLLDDLLLSRVHLSLGGKEQDVTALEAITLQLMQKQAGGDTRASRVLNDYEAHFRDGGRAPLQITFVDSNYSDNFGNATLEDDDE